MVFLLPVFLQGQFRSTWRTQRWGATFHIRQAHNKNMLKHSEECKNKKRKKKEKHGWFNEGVQEDHGGDIMENSYTDSCKVIYHQKAPLPAPRGAWDWQESRAAQTENICIAYYRRAWVITTVADRLSQRRSKLTIKLRCKMLCNYIKYSKEDKYAVEL